MKASPKRPMIATTCTVGERCKDSTGTISGETAMIRVTDRRESRSGPTGMLMPASSCIRMGTDSISAGLRRRGGHPWGGWWLPARGNLVMRGPAHPPPQFIHVLLEARFADRVKQHALPTQGRRRQGEAGTFVEGRAGRGAEGPPP